MLTVTFMGWVGERERDEGGEGTELQVHSPLLRQPSYLPIQECVSPIGWRKWHCVGGTNFFQSTKTGIQFNHVQISPAAFCDRCCLGWGEGGWRSKKYSIQESRAEPQPLGITRHSQSVRACKVPYSCAASPRWHLVKKREAFERQGTATLNPDIYWQPVPWRITIKQPSGEPDTPFLPGPFLQLCTDCSQSIGNVLNHSPGDESLFAHYNRASSQESHNQLTDRHGQGQWDTFLALMLLLAVNTTVQCTQTSLNTLNLASIMCYWRPS